MEVEESGKRMKKDIEGRTGIINDFESDRLRTVVEG